MPFTPTPLYCSNCDCQQLKAGRATRPKEALFASSIGALNVSTGFRRPTTQPLDERLMK